jgi:hypothetical protein
VTPRNYLGQPPLEGVTSVSIVNTGAGTLSPVTDNGDGTYSAVLTAAAVEGVDTLVITVDAGGQVTELNNKPVVTYFTCGDIDGSGGDPNVADLTYLVSFLFSSGDDPPFPPAANVNGTSGINVADLTYLVEYLFRNGPGLLCGPVA